MANGQSKNPIYQTSFIIFQEAIKTRNIMNNKLYTNNGTAVIPNTYESGESVGVLLPSQYYGDLAIDGKPYTFFGPSKPMSSISLNQLKTT